MKHVTVLTSSKSSGIGSGLTYTSDDTSLEPGKAVKVPLRNKLIEGIVLEVLEKRAKDDYDVKEVQEVLEGKPLLTEAQMKTLHWMSEYYFCSLRQALTVFLPPPPWKNLLGKTEEIPTEVAEVNLPTLSPLQKKVYEEITASKKPSLLFGITGSGKTEIYATLIADSIKQGKQALLLVPEILLTEHTIHRFETLLDREHIAVLHSRLTPASRKKEWRRIHQGGVSLVIGSRSALFAPFEKLGLVIIDEEHEWTYKNEQTPRYHTRETAEKLCEFAGAKFVMGTATPSLEAWSRAKSGRYTLVRLPERYGSNELPNVRIIDLAQVSFGKLYPFSTPLLDAIEDRLKKGEQSVLFLNHRGIATSLLCLECRRRVVSPESQLPFTVHRQGNREYLRDHTTGTIANMPVSCPACGSSNLKAVGAGTQKIEEILTERFFNARILRADSDTISHPEQMRLLLRKMRENEADILLGTQSVVKGLDLPNVTLAAVILADVGLSLPHFRAGERIFQLMTQLTGRSGRAKPGEVIIQTFRPDAPEVKLAAEHRTEDFLEQELKMRIFAGYPPITEMTRLIFRGPLAQSDAKEALKKLQAHPKAKVLKLSASPTFFGGGKIWHVLIRGENLPEIISNSALDKAIIDRDPIECL